MIKNRKIWILVAAIFIILSFIILKFSRVPAQKTANVCFGQNCFQSEIARDDAELQKGLMDRDGLDQDKGMLFVFNKEDKHSFWMKNTKIPLDVIWMSKDGKIVDIQTLSPCISDKCPTFSPKTNAQFVLEINAGLTKKDNIKIGDLAILK